MEEMTRKDQKVMKNQAGGSRPLPATTEVGDSNNDGTKVQLNEEPILGFIFDNEEDDVKKQRNNDYFSMLIEEDESSGFHHFTSKPKPKKKRKPTMSRKEFIELKGTINQILVAVTSS